VNVGELIEVLSHLNPEVPVDVRDGQGGWYEVIEVWYDHVDGAVRID
jgi:hypothetical protein